MEQQLINEMIKLMDRVGMAHMIPWMVKKVTEQVEPPLWTAGELQQAIDDVQTATVEFGETQAVALAKALRERFPVK
jgi:hypothetical protein